MLTAIKGNIIQAVTLDTLDIRENAYLILDDGIIQGIFPSLPERYASAVVTDYGNSLILQSFCDMHLHAPQYPMLGMGMDLPLLDWLTRYAYPTEAAFSDPDYAREIYRRLARELVENGTTCVCAFSSSHTDASLVLMEELEYAGVTGYVGKVSMDRNAIPYYQETTAESIRETERFVDACGRFTHIKPILTPRFTPACSDELMQALGALARERGLYVQSHLSENRGEISWVRELHPDCAAYWQTYEKYGLLDSHTLMAHCVHSDQEERRTLRDRGAYVVHCADSNINIASGVCPVRTMLNEGVPVLLGSDIAGGAQLSMLDVITMTLRASKMKRIQSDWQTDFLTVQQAYYLATSAAAEYFGRHAGFHVGEPLYAVVLDDRDLPRTDALDVRQRFERCFYLCGKQNITAVFGNGRKIK